MVIFAYIQIILCISFLEWIGYGSWPDQFLVARAASVIASYVVYYSKLCCIKLCCILWQAMLPMSPMLIA